MIRSLFLCFAVLAAASTGGLAWMLVQPAPPDPRVAKLEGEIAAMKGENARLRGLLQPPPAAPPPPPAAPPPPPGGSGGREDGAGAGTTAGGAAGSAPAFLVSPARMRESMIRRNAQTIDTDYARLIAMLGFNAEETARFKQLLMDREMASVEQTVAYAEGATPAEMKKMSEAGAQKLKEFDAAIKTFLNHGGDYATFKHWEDTRLDRRQYERSGRAMYAASPEPLSEQQEQQMIDLISKVRRGTKTSWNYREPEVYRQQLEAMHQKMLEQAAGMGAFTPGQVNTLGIYLEQSRNNSVQSSATFSVPPAK